jgi:molecular chaperone GrpE
MTKEEKHKKDKKHSSKHGEHPKKTNELEELKNKYLRTLADLDNLRKRSAQEREDIISFANETLILALLPVMDSFDRAFESMQKIKTDEEVLKGIGLIKKQLEDALAKAGVCPIDAVGVEFDPNRHEAVMKKKSEEQEEGTVIEIAQKGYALCGKVIRPAMVIISEK